MTVPWIQSIVVSCFEDESPYRLYCEPEGDVQDLEPGDVMTLTFAGVGPHAFEIARVADGIVLGRQGDSEVSIADKRGRTLRW